MGQRHLPQWARLSLLGGMALLFAIQCQGGLRQDEVECEQAANQLENCCPAFDVTMLNCSYSSNGCSTVYPALTIAESECIASESCAQLVSTGVCSRAAAALPMQIDDAGYTDSPEVCP
jgi:hypothetical protein